MTPGFIDRTNELAALARARALGGLVAVYGRRRVGKTRLLRHWLSRQGGLYAQAIEAPSGIQLDQIFQDLRGGLVAPAAPANWEELFAIFDQQKEGLIVCLDEFPYLVQADPTLPSRLQRWWDHRPRKKQVFVLCGSSRRMMHDALLDETAPLYGRSRLILNVGAMGYGDFCEALALRRERPASFELYSLVGGLPKYWELLGRERSPISAAELLYFGFAAYMENEPRRLLLDEQIGGSSPLGVLEAVGRGAHKPSEIAGRMGVPQTQLAKVLYALLDSGLLRREVPLGQSERNPKNVFYGIDDPSLRFWYQVCSPHRSRWKSYSLPEKERLLGQHASTVFEDHVRSRLPGARRYWEKCGEFDLVRPQADGRPPGEGVIVAEVKARSLRRSEQPGLLRDLQLRWSRTEASRRWPRCRFELIDYSFLRTGK